MNTSATILVIPIGSWTSRLGMPMTSRLGMPMGFGSTLVQITFSVVHQVMYLLTFLLVVLLDSLSSLEAREISM